MQILKNLKHIFFASILSLCVIFSGIFLLGKNFTDEMNMFFLYRTTENSTMQKPWQDRIYTHDLPASDQIRVITIDDATLNEFQSQWDLKMLTIPKSKYIELIEALESIGVKGIAFDIIFQNADPDEDQFAQVMNKYNNIVIAAEASSASVQCATDPDGKKTCDGYPRTVYASVPWGNIFLSDPNWLIRPVRSGVASSVLSSETSTNHALAPLALELYRWAWGVFTGAQSTLVTPFFSESSRYKRVSLSTFLKRRDLLASDFRDKYVFVWESGTRIHDSITNPVTGTAMDGVLSHAHLLDGLLQWKLLRHITPDIMMIIVIVLVFLSTSSYILVHRYASPVVFVVFLIAWLWCGRYIYDVHRIVVDIALVFSASGIITYPMVFTYKFFVIDREKRELQKNFGHYIDPEVVKQIADRSEEIQLGWEKRELTVLFSDIAGFTTISEKLEPQDLFYLMTSYLSNMTDILIGQWGTLDKYIGDAVMGFFWAPLRYDDHAARACRTALLMRRALPWYNQEIVSHGIDAIDFRVGIASGNVMVGNIGSHDRFNYTVLGDTVNLASRLEWTGKEYGVHIIVSEVVKNQTGSEFIFRELDTIAVKWKTEWIRIYELLGYATESIDMTVYTRYEQALGLYRAGRYLDAQMLWETQQDDAPSRILALRTREILAWEVRVENGVYHMTHK